MAQEDKTLIERDRIKAIIIRKIESLIKEKEKYNKESHKRKENICRLNKLQDDILFLVDNPDYVRKTKEGPEDSEEENE